MTLSLWMAVKHIVAGWTEHGLPTLFTLDKCIQVSAELTLFIRISGHL